MKKFNVTKAATYGTLQAITEGTIDVIGAFHTVDKRQLKTYILNGLIKRAHALKAPAKRGF